MAMSRFTKLFLLFEPEDSTRPSKQSSEPINAFQPLVKRSDFSIKALVWVVISIIVGMSIGQL